MSRLLVLVLTVVVALGGAVALIAFLQSRDDASISDGQAAPGEAAPEETDPRLRAGNVIFTYRRAEDGAVLRALAEETAGPPDPALEEAGAAVLVLRRPDQSEGPVVAHAVRRRLVTDAADDPRLREFTEYWLGRGADAG